MKKKIMIIATLIFGCLTVNSLSNEYNDNTNASFIGRVTASSLFIRSEPSSTASIVGKVLINRRIDVKSITDKKETINGQTAYWYEVESTDGFSGYSFGAFIKKSTPKDDLKIRKSPSVFKFNLYKTSRDCSEKEVIAKTNGKVKRNGNELIIKCKNGTILKYKDNNDEGTDAVSSHVLVHYYSDVNQYLIVVRLYEGFMCILVNASSGDSLDVWGEPFYSKDKKKFICVSCELPQFYQHNGIQIFRFDNQSVTKEFEVEVKWGPSNPIWTDNNNIDLIHYELSEKGDLLPFQSNIEFFEGEWILH
jgi:hypothetical protein